MSELFIIFQQQEMQQFTSSKSNSSKIDAEIS